MNKFIEITDLAGDSHSINVSHIVEVYQQGEGDVLIKLSIGNPISASTTKANVLGLIND